MSGASKFHTWKFSWFERLIYFFAPHGKSEPSDSDELGKATCVTNTRVTEYSVNHLFLHPFTRSTLSCEKKLHPFDLTVRKNFASVQPFDLTIQKNLHPFSRSTLLFEKILHPFLICLLAVRSVVRTDAVRNVFV